MKMTLFLQAKEVIFLRRIMTGSHFSTSKNDPRSLFCGGHYSSLHRLMVQCDQCDGRFHGAGVHWCNHTRCIQSRVQDFAAPQVRALGSQGALYQAARAAPGKWEIMLMRRISIPSSCGRCPMPKHHLGEEGVARMAPSSPSGAGDLHVGVKWEGAIPWGVQQPRTYPGGCRGSDGYFVPGGREEAPPPPKFLQPDRLQAYLVGHLSQDSRRKYRNLFPGPR